MDKHEILARDTDKLRIAYITVTPRLLLSDPRVDWKPSEVSAQFVGVARCIVGVVAVPKSLLVTYGVYAYCPGKLSIYESPTIAY
jgi:hypothetical protein